MILRSFWLLSGLLSCAFADVKVVTPAAGASISGTTLDIEWEESGTDPPLSEFVNYSLFLCAGGDTESTYIPVATLVSGGSFKKGSSISITLQPGVGADTENAYFLKFLNAAPGGSIVNYSDRFSLTSMDGTFPPVVLDGLKTVSGTAGPPTENDIQTPQNNPAAAPAAPAAASASYALPYTMQTGPIRYAPMPKIGQTSITAKAPSMQYPTSAYDIARTYLGSADCISTAVPAVTEVFSTIENTVSIHLLLRCHRLTLAGHCS